MKNQILFLFCILFLHCQRERQVEFFFPSQLPSEEQIKRTLAISSHREILVELATQKGFTLDAWKEEERMLVRDQDIQRYWLFEKEKNKKGFLDGDHVDSFRKSLVIRLVWARIFRTAGIEILPDEFDLSLLHRLDVKNTPNLNVKKPKWTIIEWSDYACTFCKQTFPYTKEIIAKHPGQIRYIKKAFPLDEESKEGMSLLALSQCLWEKDKIHFWESSALLYIENQRIRKREYSVHPDCNLDSLSEVYFHQVRKDLNEAKAFGIQSIPTFWINGRWVVGALNVKTWEKTLEQTKP